MLELDACGARALGHEADLDLGGHGGVIGPLGVELPQEDEPVGRFVHVSHAAQVALGPVGAALVPAAADEGLHHDGDRSDRADVVGLEGPPRAEAGGEHLEGALLGGGHGDGRAHGDEGGSLR